MKKYGKHINYIQISDMKFLYCFQLCNFAFKITRKYIYNYFLMI